MARTVLHTRLQDGIDKIGSVSQKIDAATTQIGAIPATIGGTFGALSDRLADMSAKLELIHIALLATTGRDLPSPTQAAFNCIRVLNQVEDLITDRDFLLERNNQSLYERSIEGPTQDCVRTLEADPDLQNRFKRVYRPFADGSFSTLAERYSELDQLRRDIVRHFRPSAPSPSPAEGAEQKRSSKK